MTTQENEPQQPVEISSAAAFKKNRQGKVLKLPSGAIVRARRVELKTFLRQGAIPNSLLGIVQDALNKGKTQDAEALLFAEAMDLEKVDEMYQLVNAVIMAIVVEPKVHPLPPAPDGVDPKEAAAAIEDAKDENNLYIDEIDDEDKMFLFQWSSGGTADLTTFREEARAGMAPLASGQDAGNSA